ncbi:olfactory receptor 10V1 [Pseudonaja textilis]|nr:olfactory receptor 10V1 [Pseudonaja textilis]
MESANNTGLTYFYFHPFSTIPEVRLLMFVFFLVLFLLSLLVNPAVLLGVHNERSLHTPMYFFLSSLAMLEIVYSFVLAPLTLANLLSAKKPSISLPGCGTQMFFFIFLGSSDCFLLSVMAYDRYVAICQPLRYSSIMSWKVCTALVAGTFTICFLFGMQITILILRLPFCGNHEINHFFCDFPAVLKLACGDTHAHHATFFIISAIVMVIPFLLILISYIFIVRAILRISTTSGRQRAFSTCSSHLMLVIMQYACASVTYLRPGSRYSSQERQVVSICYTFGTPVLNPLIYTMRNRELKDALTKILRKYLLCK